MKRTALVAACLDMATTSILMLLLGLGLTTIACSDGLEGRVTELQSIVETLTKERDTERTRATAAEEGLRESNDRSAGLAKEKDQLAGRVATLTKERDDALARVRAANAARTARPSAAPTADRWEAQVRVQMLAAALAAGLKGFTLDSIRSGQLRDDSAHRITVDVGTDRSKSYVIIGACDADCDDLDLELFEPDGQLVNRDVGVDDYPMVAVPQGHIGEHLLRVVMAQCRVAPCRYGYAVFSR